MCECSLTIFAATSHFRKSAVAGSPRETQTIAVIAASVWRTETRCSRASWKCYVSHATDMQSAASWHRARHLRCGFGTCASGAGWCAPRAPQSTPPAAVRTGTPHTCPEHISLTLQVRLWSLGVRVEDSGTRAYFVSILLAGCNGGFENFHQQTCVRISATGEVSFITSVGVVEFGNQ